MTHEGNRPGVGPASSDVKQTMQREAESARDAAKEIGESVKKQASEVASDLQGQAQQVISEQKEMAVSGLSDVASAIRRAAEDLESREQPQVANLVRNLASGVEQVSHSISRRNLSDMMSEVERFARNHPTAFLGGSVLAGLALARFAKSSSRPQQSYQSQWSEHSRQHQDGSSPYSTEHRGQGGQLSDFARREREHGSGTDTSSTR